MTHFPSFDSSNHAAVSHNAHSLAFPSFDSRIHLSLTHTATPAETHKLSLSPPPPLSITHLDIFSLSLKLHTHYLYLLPLSYTFLLSICLSLSDALISPVSITLSLSSFIFDSPSSQSLFPHKRARMRVLQKACPYSTDELRSSARAVGPAY